VSGQNWELRTPRSYLGRTPRLLRPACHDRTPFLSIEHDCGERLHLHESQVRGLDRDTDILARCPSCSHLLLVPAAFLFDAFAELRREGWIA